MADQFIPTDATQEQALTVAQEDRSDADLLRLIAKDHARLAPNAYHSAETLMQIADRLASVSSASAEGTVDYPAGAIENGREFLRRLGEYDCAAGAISMSTDYQESVRCFEWLSETCAQYANALNNPEPVPATNQAGEVAREKLQQTWDLMSSLPPLIFSESEADHLIATIAALATQPATSQEGEDNCPKVPDSSIAAPTPDYNAAWKALSQPLSWMHDNRRLMPAYWGWNLADIANDLIDKAYPGLRSGEIVGTTEETVNPVLDPVNMLIAWARDNQAFPENHPGGSGWGHIDEKARFRLRDMIAAIDAVQQ